MPVLAIPAILVALIALLLVLAAATLAYVASRVVPNVPLIGGAIRGAIVNAISAAVSVLRGWANGAAVPAGYLFMGIALGVWWLVAFVVNTVEHAGLLARAAVNWADYLYNVVHSYAASLYWSAVGYSQTLYNQSVAHANALYNSAIGTADTLYDQAIGTAEHLYNDAIGTANALHADAVGVAEHLYNVAEGDIQAVAATVANGLAATAATAEADLARAISDANAAATAAEQAATAAAAGLASAAAGGAVAALDVAAADVVNPALAAIESAYGAIVHDIPADLAGVLHLPGTLAGVNVKDLAGALGLLSGIVAAVATETADCVIPQCHNLGGLSNLFGDLTDAALLGALLALLVEAAHDPERAAADIGSDFGAVVNGTASGFRSLIGV